MAQSQRYEKIKGCGTLNEKIAKKKEATRSKRFFTVMLIAAVGYNNNTKLVLLM